MSFLNAFIDNHPYGFTYKRGFEMLFLCELEWRLWWLTVKLDPKSAYLTQPRGWLEDDLKNCPAEDTP